MHMQESRAGRAVRPLLLLVLSFVTCAAGALDPAEESLRTRVDALVVEPRVGPAAVADPWLLTRFYEQREFSRVWSDTAKLESLISVLEGSKSHGLNPVDYHLEELRAIHERDGAEAPDASAVELELLATDALARFAFHLRFGKVNPEALETSWNFSRTLEGVDPLRVLRRLVDSDDLGAALDALAPQETRYAELRSALAVHREIAGAGGWPRVSAGETLRPGMRSPRVEELRNRLEASGDLEQDDGQADRQLYDQDLEAAARRFQARHGLEVDAIVGVRTLAALNVPVETRIDQLRVNLERVRWVFRDLEPRIIVSNIARFRTTLYEDGEPVWSTRSVVGRPYRQTPVFRGRMTYLVFNPTWTVPPGILARDILPEIRRDPETLVRRNMSVLDRSGRPVDPSTIDWAVTPTRGFPYMIRQEPGPDNALGRVKFMFPNRHHVYMHDTPARELFGQTERAFSSGCIRLEDPLELAEILLEGQAGWNRAAIDRTLGTARERTVTLPRPLTVLLIYATVVPEDGEIIFLADIYNRDTRLMAALDAEFEFTPPEGYFEVVTASPSP